MATKRIYNSEFPAVDEQAWRKLAERALGGESFEDALVRQSEDGIRIEPVYSRREPRPLLRSNPGRPWIPVQRIDDPDPERANSQALEEVAGGAEGLALVFEGAPNSFGFGIPASPEALARTLDGVPLDRIHLRIDAHPAGRASIDWAIELYGARRVPHADLSFSLGLDPAANFAGTGALPMSIEALHAWLPQSLAHFFVLGLPGVLMEADGRVYHNAGATAAQELGAMLAGAAWHLRMFEEARQPLVYAVPHIGFALSADHRQFDSIAKIRALRQLWSRMQEACGLEPMPAIIHAETSWRMLTKADPETNILRSTVAAFAAAVGGADSISVLPHTLSHGLPDAFARRIARNTQLILQKESHLGFVADPAAGAGGIEALTDALCERAWAQFQQIEANGGLFEVLHSGRLQDEIAAAATRRGEQVAAGRLPIIGTTRYPAPSERPVTILSERSQTPPASGAVECTPLLPRRTDESGVRQ